MASSSTQFVYRVWTGGRRNRTACRRDDMGGLRDGFEAQICTDAHDDRGSVRQRGVNCVGNYGRPNEHRIQRMERGDFANRLDELSQSVGGWPRRVSSIVCDRVLRVSDRDTCRNFC